MEMLRKRFNEYLEKSNETECILFQGPVNRDGYGQISAFGKQRTATHVAWFLEHNVWPTKFVLHRCNVKRCVNPAHLYEGTQSDNVLDTVKDDIHWESRKTHCKRGHPFAGTNLIPRNGKRECRKCKNELQNKRYFLRRISL